MSRAGLIALAMLQSCFLTIAVNAEPYQFTFSRQRESQEPLQIVKGSVHAEEGQTIIWKGGLNGIAFQLSIGKWFNSPFINYDIVYEKILETKVVSGTALNKKDHISFNGRIDLLQGQTFVIEGGQEGGWGVYDVPLPAFPNLNPGNYRFTITRSP